MLPVIALAVGLSAYVRASGADAQIARIFSGGHWRMLLVAAFDRRDHPGVRGRCPADHRGAAGGGRAPGAGGRLLAGLADHRPGDVDGGPSAPSASTWPLAKTFAAVAIGLLGGLATHAIQAAGGFADPLKPNRFAAPSDCAAACDGGLTWQPWRDPARRRRLLGEARAAAQTMLIWLSIAFALEAVLRQVLPPELIAGLVGGDSPWAIPLAVLVGTPIYLDGYAALPLVRGLIELGMSPGAALAFLVSGGITSAYASVAVFALVRWPVFLGYLGMAILGSIGAGYAYALAVTAMS